MQREIIAVDVDDVLGDENGAMHKFINERYGLNLTLDDYRLTRGEYWDFWDRVWRVDKEEGKKRYEAFLDSGIKEVQPLIAGAVEAMNILKLDYDLVVVTSRTDRFFDITREWLNRHFPDTFSKVEFVHAWTGDAKTNKALICKTIGAAYLIDDSFDHCRESAEAGVKAILFGDYGWNRHQELPNGVIRLKTWHEVIRYFKNERN